MKKVEFVSMCIRTVQFMLQTYTNRPVLRFRSLVSKRIENVMRWNDRVWRLFSRYFFVSKVTSLVLRFVYSDLLSLFQKIILKIRSFSGVQINLWKEPYSVVKAMCVKHYRFLNTQQKKLKTFTHPNGFFHSPWFTCSITLIPLGFSITLEMMLACSLVMTGTRPWVDS